MPGEIFKYDTTIKLYMTDAVGFLFFAEQFRMVQDALEAFLESRGMPVRYFIDKAPYSMPVVHASSNFKAPLRVGDRVTVQLQVRDFGESAITLSHEIYKDGKDFTGGGETVHVSIDKRTGETINLPREIIDKLKQ